MWAEPFIFKYASLSCYEKGRWVLSRNNNYKEEKRVMNALYTPYKIFSESHAPEFKN